MTTLVYEWPAYDVMQNFDRNSWFPSAGWRWSFHGGGADGLRPMEQAENPNYTVFYDGHVSSVAYLAGIRDAADYTTFDNPQ